MKKVLFLFLLFVMGLFAKVDINHANTTSLATLKGIGIKKAEAIVEYRKENGRFKSIDELTKVKGIGKKMLEKIKDDIEIK